MRNDGKLAGDLPAVDGAGHDRYRPAPRHAAPGRVCETVSLMEYVILIIVIAVLAVGVGGWLLFLRPRPIISTSCPIRSIPGCALALRRVYAIYEPCRNS